MTHRIAYLPGDGIGPEVGAAACSVLDVIARKTDTAFQVEEYAIGGAAIDAEGAPLPQRTRDAAIQADAVLLGAIGGPKWETLPGNQRPEQGLLDLRETLGVWANLRVFKPQTAAAALSPVKADRLAGVDFIVVRELTGGIYFGEKRREGDRAVDVCAYTVGEVERVARRAGALARTRGKHVTSIDKANVMETSRLWRETVSRVMAHEFPDVTLEHLLVDAAAMHLINQPGRFDVIVTENLFGDVLTDEAAVLCGALGLVPSASLGDGSTGLYEPIHGSAPDIAGQGVANPAGMLLSTALMLRWSLGLERAADALEAAVADALEAGTATRDLGGEASTSEVTRAVADRLETRLSG